MAKIATVANVSAEAPVNGAVVNSAVSESVAKVDTSITIDTDFAIPDRIRSGGKPKYPWADLAAPEKLADGRVKCSSFFVAGAKVETFYTMCASASKRYEGRKFIARKWDGEGGVKGVRVWRSE